MSGAACGCEVDERGTFVVECDACVGKRILADVDKAFAVAAIQGGLGEGTRVGIDWGHVASTVVVFIARGGTVYTCAVEDLAQLLELRPSLRGVARQLGLTPAAAADDDYPAGRRPSRAEVLEVMAQAVAEDLAEPDPFSATMIPRPRPAEPEPAPQRGDIPPWRGEQWRRDRRRR